MATLVVDSTTCAISASLRAPFRRTLDAPVGNVPPGRSLVVPSTTVSDTPGSCSAAADTVLNNTRHAANARQGRIAVMG